MTCRGPPMTLSKPHLFFKHLPDLGAGILGSSCLLQKILETLTQDNPFIPVPVMVRNECKEFKGDVLSWSHHCSPQQLAVGASLWLRPAAVQLLGAASKKPVPGHRSVNNRQFSESGRTRTGSRRVFVAQASHGLQDLLL